MAITQLYLVRHGEQQEDGSLSANGRDQADHLGRRVQNIPFAMIHYSSLPRAAQTAERIRRHLPPVAAHACDFVADRTPVPADEHRDQYPSRWHGWLDAVPEEERDRDAGALQAAVAHFGVTGDEDRHELLITHNFVIGWFVRHVLDAPVWRWMGLDQANCGLTIVRWDDDRPPALVAFNDTGHLER